MNGRVVEQASLDASDTDTLLQFVDGMSSAHGVSVQSATPGVWIEHTKFMYSDPLIVRCRDQAGRDLLPEINHFCSLNGETATYRWIPLHLFPDSTSCDLEIIPNIETFVFEFIVKPPSSTVTGSIPLRLQGVPA